VPELRVIGRTSSFSYKGKDTKLAEVARELNVAHILEGSVRTSGNRVRITAQLVRASDSSHLWSETYDRTLDDIFAVQDEIATAVVTELKLALLGAQQPAKRQIDPELYSKYLLARQLRLAGSTESRQKSVELLQAVLAADPGYAQAWVDLAANYTALASNGIYTFADGYAKARDAANRALALDPSLAAAHAMLSRVAWDYEGNAADASRHIASAVALAPSDSDALYSAANFALGICRRGAMRRPWHPLAQATTSTWARHCC
jgi:adenylate cyclase